MPAHLSGVKEYSKVGPVLACMDGFMGSVNRFVVLIAVLILPSRLFAQVYEPIPQQITLQPVPAAAEPAQEAAAPADDLSHSRSAWPASCCAHDDPACHVPFESVFVFGGQYTKRSMGNTADAFNVTYDNKYAIAVGYQRFPWSSQHFYWGWEVGTASRFGGDFTQEFWGGPAVRHHGFAIGDMLTITSALTGGFSIVTDTMGHEAYREVTRHGDPTWRGDATFLYYLGPEIILSTPSRPDVEIFYRLHHRCGGGRTLGDLTEGYNANCLGVRWKF